MAVKSGQICLLLRVYSNQLQPRNVAWIGGCLCEAWRHMPEAERLAVVSAFHSCPINNNPC